GHDTASSTVSTPSLHDALPIFDFPKLLEADAEFLRIAALVELELADQFLGERTAHAFSEKRVLAAQFHARRVAVLRLAVLANAQDRKSTRLNSSHVKISHGVLG